MSNMTLTTSVTVFFFPARHFMQSHAVGIISAMVAGGCDLCAAFPALDWRLTQSLCSVRRVGFMFKRFCRDRAGFPQATTTPT
jgi:hypothetical protein